MKKSFAVLGLGKFGETVAVELAKIGMEVLVVDNDKEKINNIADDVTYAVQADVKDMETMKSLGIKNVDVVIVCMADDMESSIMAVIEAKELGVPMVIAKAKSLVAKQILEKVGADLIVFPENDAGIRIARRLASTGIVDYFGLSETVSIIEVSVKNEWIGKSLKELDFRKKYKVNVIGIKYNENIDVDLDPDRPIKEGAVLVIIGNNDMLNKF